MAFDFLKSQARLLYEQGAISKVEFIVMRSDGRFSKLVVTSAVIMTTLYALAMCLFTVLNISHGTSVYPPAEFTAGYFAFWTVEVVMLASIKKSRVRNKHEREDLKGDILLKLQDRISPGGPETDRPEEGDTDAAQGRHIR